MSSKRKINTLNTPYLVIVESPSKCEKIEKYLGFEYKCIASKGHIREIKKIDYKKNYKPEFEIIKEKSKTVKDLIEITSKFDKSNIFIGTDDDREGEGIGWHICEICKLDIKTTKRIIFHEITKDALTNAVKNPITIRMNIVNAQQCRQVLDRIIGFKVSTILSKMIKHDNNNFLSAGRCQTPTLKLIYDRYKTYENKSIKLHYKIEGNFKLLNCNNKLHAKLDTTIEKEEDCISFLEKSKVWEHILTKVKKGSHKKSAPLPFNTSKLLQYISNSLHISPKQTMSICQKLYQSGYITYMRTEGTKYSKDFINNCKSYIECNYSDKYIGELEKLENKSSSNPHEAIRVTNISQKNIEDDDEKVMNVYKAIWKRSLSSCMSNYEYEESKYFINAPESNEYTGTIEYPTFIGWKVIEIKPEIVRQEQDNYYKTTTIISKLLNKRMEYDNIVCSVTTSDVENYFQEASLINKLETIGIGRPSTFSMLVDTIQERKYVTKMDIEGDSIMVNEYCLEENTIKNKSTEKKFGSSKKSLKIKDLGINCIKLLYEYFDELFCYDYTKKMEDELDKLVNNPDKEWYDICNDCDTIISECTNEINKKIKKKYTIDNNNNLVFGKNGPMIESIINNETKYISIKDTVELSFEKLENNKYTLKELVDINEVCLGKYNDEIVSVKKGPYGLYLEHGTNKISLKEKYEIQNIKLEDIIENLNQEQKKNSSLLRNLNKEYSVRKGKYGNYIFYKTEKMKVPKFINIKKCPYDVLKDNNEDILKWIEELNNKDKFKK
jgi:DNA topoisomerase-1